MKSRYVISALALMTVIFASTLFMSAAVNVSSRPNERITNAASSNWAGYVVASTFTQTCTGRGRHQTCSGPSAVVTAAYGSWMVQTANPSSSDSYSSQWVGIGGYFSGDSTLIQTGTESDYISGAASYNAWYEVLPAGETVITNVPVQPGDLIDASVVCTSSCSTSTQTWRITLTDATTGATKMTTVTYSSSLLSAEWIEERPAICFGGVCTLTTLANFGTAHYGSDLTSQTGTNYATLSNSNLPIGSLNNQPITMVNCSGHGPHATCTTLATPSPPSLDGTSFTVTQG